LSFKLFEFKIHKPLKIFLSFTGKLYTVQKPSLTHYDVLSLRCALMTTRRVVSNVTPVRTNRIIVVVDTRQDL